MGEEQGSLWSNEQLVDNGSMILKKTKKSLTEKVDLSASESKEWSIPLEKGDIVKYFSDRYFDENSPDYNPVANRGVPQRILSFLSVYSGKSSEELEVKDGLVLWKSLDNLFEHPVNGTEISKFSKAIGKKTGENSFFGVSAYELLGDYLAHVGATL